MTDLHRAALIAARDCTGLREGEKVLVVTDEPCREVGRALFDVVRDAGNPVLMVEIPPRRVPGEEPPEEVAALMKTMGLVLCPTSMSMTHTDAKRSAQAMGVRIATLPGSFARRRRRRCRRICRRRCSRCCGNNGGLEVFTTEAR